MPGNPRPQLPAGYALTITPGQGTFGVMMAPDSTPNTPALSVESLDYLRDALQRYAREDSIDGIQPALRRIAQEAREKRMHPEQLLIALKDVWFGIPVIAPGTAAEAQGRMLQRVVTVCIRDYYSI